MVSRLAQEQTRQLVRPTENEFPWERIPGEGVKAYAAFLAYRNLPTRDRTLPAAAKAHYGFSNESKIRMFSEWSRNWMWIERANAWDAYLLRKRDEDLIDKIRKANDKHVQVANALLVKAVDRLKGMEPLELSPHETIAMLTAAIDIERRALGEPTEIIEEAHKRSETLTFMEMTDEQLHQRLIGIRLQRLAQSP